MHNVSHSVEAGAHAVIAENKLFSPSLFNKAAVFTTLLFIFLVPWADSLWDGLPRVTATLAIGFALVQLMIHGTHRNYNYFHLVTIIYFAWQIMSLMWSPDFERAKEVVTTTIQLIFLASLFCLVIDNKTRLKTAYQVYVLACIVASGIVFSNFLKGIESGYLRYGIENLTIDAVGVFLSISIPMAAYLAQFSKTKIIRMMNLLAIPLIFYGIFLTATRTAFIVGIIGLLYWVFTQRKASFIIKSVISTIMVLAFVAIALFAPKASIDRVFSAGESITQGTLNSRSLIWGGSIEQWKESPIIGVGMGGLGDALSRQHINYQDAHNSFIHVLTETGVVGLLLFLMIHVFLLYYILNTPLNEKAFLIALLTVIVVSQLATHLQTEKITWFVYAMLAMHSQLHSKLTRNN